MATKQPTADKPAAVEVVVLKGFQNGLTGNKEKDDTFLYDLEGDPHGLKAMGLVKVAPPKVEAKA